MLLPYLVKYVFKKSSFSRTAWTNCHAKLKLPSKIQPLKFVVEKILCLMMSALCKLLTRRYLPSNSHNNWFYAAAATNKKDLATKSFRTSSTFSQSLWWQVKIGLHQFDNYLSQVEINVTVNESFSCHTQDIWRVLQISAGQCPDTERVRQSAFLPVT